MTLVFSLAFIREVYKWFSFRKLERKEVCSLLDERVDTAGTSYFRQ
jgi:hypothetical protein